TGSTAVPLPAVVSFPSGGDHWRRSAAIPLASRPLYLAESGRLSFEPPAAGGGDHDSYVSDPRAPTPASARAFVFSRDGPWPSVLTEDQRFAAHRPDVMTYVSEPLQGPLHIFGQPVADLFAATTGSDADVMVKLIDVYPDDERDTALRGYELPVSMEIFRARYRDDPETATPLTPGRVFHLAFDLPLADHVFRPGHRIMVQVQSSWFPLADRNPQTFVANIFEAKPADYRPAEQTLYHAPGRASLVRLPIAVDEPATP
ncbi:MAG: CocE/NonD family hydrolase, partial [Proteobacteria bacterium]|nr:CocE/NonD family hydrolase [Pseudomonadota bacterium]